MKGGVMEEIILNDKSDVFTFAVPARRGYYYLVVMGPTRYQTEVELEEVGLLE